MCSAYQDFRIVDKENEKDILLDDSINQFIFVGLDKGSLMNTGGWLHG